MTSVSIAASMFPMAQLQEITQEQLNRCLIAWEHKMGPMLRVPGYGAWYHALIQDGEALAVTATSTLIRTHAGGGLEHLTRDTTVELSRLCAARPGLNRVMLRLWREIVFPSLGYSAAISYQDAVVHAGDTYRFDGWRRSPRRSRSGTDQRTGAIGRDKWLWVWPPQAAVVPEVATV